MSMNVLPQIPGYVPSNSQRLSVIQASAILGMLFDSFLAAPNSMGIVPVLVVADTEQSGCCWDVFGLSPASTPDEEAELWVSIGCNLRDEGTHCAGVLTLAWATRCPGRRRIRPTHQAPCRVPSPCEGQDAGTMGAFVSK